MWTVVALLLLTPIVWALLGAESLGVLDASTSQHLPGWLITPELVSTTTLMVALGAGVVVGVGRGRVAATHLSTLAHEFGHGLVAALLGGRINRITLARDGSGMAHFAFPGRRPVRRFLVSFTGYLAPGVFGLACVRVALAGLGAAWLAYLVLLLGVMLVITVRSWWGAFVALLLGAAGWALLALGTGWLAVVVVAGLAGAMLGGGVVDAAGQWRLTRAAVTTDAASMATQTGLPARFFAGLQLVCAIALAGVGLALPWVD
jgi:hypothetical protein